MTTDKDRLEGKWWIWGVVRAVLATIVLWALVGAIHPWAGIIAMALLIADEFQQVRTDT